MPLLETVLEIFKQLIGMDEKSKLKNQIFEAFHQGQYNKIKEIITANPDLINADLINYNSRPATSTTLLHLLVAGNHIENREMINWSIEKGANVNALDSKKQTPLHYATKEINNLNLVKILVAADADIELLDDYNKSPLDYATLAAYTLGPIPDENNNATKVSNLNTIYSLNDNARNSFTFFAVNPEAKKVVEFLVATLENKTKNSADLVEQDTESLDLVPVKKTDFSEHEQSISIEETEQSSLAL